jgi:hypothetical protein
VTMSARIPKYRPQDDLQIGPGFLYSQRAKPPITVGVHAHLANLLASWTDFATLDEAVLRSLNIPVSGAFAQKQLNRRSTLFHSGPGGEFASRLVGLVESKVYPILQRSPTFTTLREQLEKLVSSEVLICEDELVNLCRSYWTKSTKNAPSTIDVVGFATHDCSERLHRSVTSFVEHFHQFGHCPYSVLAGSSDEGSRDIRFLSDKLSSCGAGFEYLGPRHKQTLIKALVTAGVPPSVVRFGFNSFNNNGARTDAEHKNVLLTYLKDRICLIVTDNAIGQPVSLRSTPSVVVTEKSSHSVWLLEGQVDIQEYAISNQLDILGLHSEFLGRSLVEIISKSHDVRRLQFGQLSGQLMRSLRSDSGTIVITGNGSAQEIFLDPDLVRNHVLSGGRGSFLKDRKKYERALGVSSFLWGTEDVVVSHPAGLLPDSCFGLDCREGCVPPFIPQIKMQSMAFNTMLNKCASECYRAFLPFALTAQNENDHHRRGYPGKIHVDDILIALIDACELPVGTQVNSARIRALGGYFVELSSLSEVDFAEAIRLSLCRKLASKWVDYQQLTIHAPAFLTNDLHASLDAMQRASLRDDFVIPFEMASERGLTEHLIQLRLFIHQVGSLLMWWPDILQIGKTVYGRSSSSG